MSVIKPLYLMAGGNRRSSSAMMSAMSRAMRECERQKPRVAYIGAANGDNAIFYGMVKSVLLGAGAGEVFMVALAKDEIDLPKAKGALESADAVFLSGGEVEDGMKWLEKHGLVDFMRELRDGGKLFFGVSAGTIMLGRCWVRWGDPGDDGTAELFDCLGFAPTTLDTHAEDEDWKELKAALRLQGPGARGYGIPMDGVMRFDEGKLENLEKEALRYVNDAGNVRLDD